MPGKELDPSAVLAVFSFFPYEQINNRYNNDDDQYFCKHENFL
jgi:hypothetical protein